MANKLSDVSIEEDTNYFKRMLDLIPPQSYFDSATKEQLRSRHAEFAQTKETKNKPVQMRKQKNKEKKKRENPLQTKSVSELQEEMVKQSNKNSSKSTFTEIKTKKPRLEPEAKRPPNPLTTVNLDLDDKRARLRAKIEELQAKRKLNDSDKILKRRLKRQESKMKLKQKRKALKQGKQNLSSDSNSNVNVSNKTPNKNFSTPSKPIFNKEGQMVFSKFDFTDSNKKEKHKNEFRGKDYKRLLEKIEKRNEKINKVKSKDETAGKMLQDKYKWKAAFDKAEGEKVKDNPELLKKALKRKEKMKVKTKKKWQDRENTVKKHQEAKQEKRNKNIKARKQAKKDNKLKKAKKKGRVIPGF